jgi:hypothetical protein
LVPNAECLDANAPFDGKYIPDFIALGAVEDGFAFAIFERGLQPQRKKFADNLPLGGFCGFRASSTATGVLHRKMKRGGAGFVPQRGITASSKETFHRGGAAGADGSVQGRRAIFVLRKNVGSGVEQAFDCLHLPLCIPIGAVDVAIRRKGPLCR